MKFAENWLNMSGEMSLGSAVRLKFAEIGLTEALELCWIRWNRAIKCSAMNEAYTEAFNWMRSALMGYRFTNKLTTEKWATCYKCHFL